MAILAIPALVPVAIAAELLRKRRLRKSVITFHCLQCGSILGAQSIHLANKKWASILTAILNSHPDDVRLRIVRDLDAICPDCGCPYVYRDQERTFVVRDKQSPNGGAF